MRGLFNAFSISRAAVVLVAALALPAAAGCAGSNRETYVREHAGEHIYARPMPEVWAAAKQLLTDEGFSGREVRGGWAYVTEWKEEGTGSTISGTATRYLLEGKEMGPSRCAVRFTRVARSTGASASGIGQSEGTHSGMAPIGLGTGSTDAVGTPATSSKESISQKSSLTSGRRDLEMEWKLLKKLDPQAAGAIEAQAVRAYPDD